MTQQIGPYGIYNPNAQNIGGGVNNPSGGGPVVTGISAWPMNEGSGLVLNDVSSNANTANINTGASVVWTANSIKSGVTSPVWQGTGFALATSTSLTNFDGTTPFTLSIWFVWQGITAATLIGTLDAAGGTFRGWELAIEPTGSVAELFVINTYPINALQVQGAFTPVAGTLYNIVATYDGSQIPSAVKIYAQGISQTTAATVNTLTATSANGLPVRFAARNNGAAPAAFPMAYAEIWNSVLSAGTIAANFAAGPGVY